MTGYPLQDARPFNDRVIHKGVCYVMKTKPTLYIIDIYKDGTNDLEETISFPIYETNEQSLLPYMNKNCDIWLGRHNKRRGKLIKLEPLRFGDKAE